MSAAGPGRGHGQAQGMRMQWGVWGWILHLSSPWELGFVLELTEEWRGLNPWRRSGSQVWLLLCKLNRTKTEPGILFRHFEA